MSLKQPFCSKAFNGELMSALRNLATTIIRMPLKEQKKLTDYFGKHECLAITNASCITLMFIISGLDSSRNQWRLGKFHLTVFVVHVSGLWEKIMRGKLIILLIFALV